MIQGFPATGVIGFVTDSLSVSRVTAINDGEYGIARFESTRSRMVDNRTAGNEEAGLYVGDSPDADTVVSGNRTWNNGFGVFIRHAHNTQVTDNESFGNCLWGCWCLMTASLAAPATSRSTKTGCTAITSSAPLPKALLL